MSDLTRQPRYYRVALLLYCIGDDAVKIVNGFSFDTPSEERTVKEILDKFEAFAIGELSETYERFCFNSRNQKTDEKFETFLTCLNELVKTCNYCTTCQPSIIRDRIVLGVNDVTTQELLLRERNLTLQSAIDICMASQTASSKSKVFQQGNTTKQESISQVDGRRKYKAKKGPKKTYRQNDRAEVKKCLFCLREHPFLKGQCPAYGKTCN